MVEHRGLPDRRSAVQHCLPEACLAPVGSLPPKGHARTAIYFLALRLERSSQRFRSQLSSTGSKLFHTLTKREPLSAGDVAPPPPCAAKDGAGSPEGALRVVVLGCRLVMPP